MRSITKIPIANIAVRTQPMTRPASFKTNLATAQTITNSKSNPIRDKNVFIFSPQVCIVIIEYCNKVQPEIKTYYPQFLPT